MLDSKVYSYKIIKSSARTKTLSLRILPSGEIIVRTPIFVKQNKIHQWMEERAPWIAKQLQQIKKKSSNQIPILKYEQGSQHYYLGEQYELLFTKINSHKETVSFENNKIQIEARSSEPEIIKNLLLSWYRAQAKILFQQRLEFFSNLMPWVKAVPHLKIRRMKSRWGSCSQSGNINLNLHLIKAPLECLDSVVVHELCHLVEFNHSPKFYSLMASYNPNWKTDKKLLGSLSKEIL